MLGCVTTLRKALRGCQMVALGAMDYVAVATPAFAHARPASKAQPQLTADDFASVPFIDYNR